MKSTLRLGPITTILGLVGAGVAGLLALVVPAQTPQPSPAPHVLRFALSEQIALTAQSAGVNWRSNTFHLVRLGAIRFERDAASHLTAAVEAGVTTFDNVDYEVNVAVFDSAGALLGTARTNCPVARMWLGRVVFTQHTLPLDFGVSLDFEHAAGFQVGISKRKVATPDEWQK